MDMKCLEIENRNQGFEGNSNWKVPQWPEEDGTNSG